jgi:hypothetical protein
MADLTPAELAMAKSFGMTPEEYEAHKDPRYKPPPPDPEKDRLKKAIREALAEKEAAV